MTETEKRFFSVDVSNDIHIVKLHETLQQAKQSCLAGAVEAHEFADDMCDHEDFASNDLPNAVYGIVVGKAECKEKQLSEEEKEDYGSDLVLEKPEIVEYPKDDGWIKCSERLPDDDGLVIAFMPSQEDDSNYWMMFIGNFDGEWWIDTGNELYNPMHVSHWKHLPQLPID
ncbi:DUF551 domain-containing protein [Pasteurella multocida subsp. multocida]|uniref:DUF551 domain-containing protein n=1 Tax=Pasteurella multocida TaxID=747 RepID=A0A9X3USD3_PASMD|nr:DUF551 domain-containing protein [Pasteurella multocida]MBF6981569.1 DUF551 domain-containing protein [Pasteurella multocida]MDA5611570.1 DUF551 domain-containing protein [Pasteurella multocida]MDA5614002.1 DUF551 domain-containing protein [Pasteurella multocida]MDA5618973.1 DUF551 domain-containing protein [Pasteurella multocida subsp. multocida]MDA5623998.1 DUF551 domain-containing protein [Pasteurella multocida]